MINKYKSLTPEEIIKKLLIITVSAAVVAYIEETYLNFIDNLLCAAAEDKKL